MMSKSLKNKQSTIKDKLNKRQKKLKRIMIKIILHQSCRTINITNNYTRRNKFKRLRKNFSFVQTRIALKINIVKNRVMSATFCTMVRGTLLSLIHKWICQKPNKRNSLLLPQKFAGVLAVRMALNFWKMILWGWK